MFYRYAAFCSKTHLYRLMKPFSQIVVAVFVFCQKNHLIAIVFVGFVGMVLTHVHFGNQ